VRGCDPSFCNVTCEGGSNGFETKQPQESSSRAALAGGSRWAHRVGRQAQGPTSDDPRQRERLADDSRQQGQIEYGQRSKYVTSVRVQHPIAAGRHPTCLARCSTCHAVAGFCWRDHASSLHYIATTAAPSCRTSTQQHTLTNTPGGSALTLTMDELKRFRQSPGCTSSSVRVPAQWEAKDVQDTHGMTAARMDRSAAVHAAQGIGLKAARMFVAEGPRK